MKIDKIINDMAAHNVIVEKISLGNSTYFDDDFSVNAYMLVVPYDRAEAIEKYFKNKKSLILEYSKSIYPERVYYLFDKFEKMALEEHENRIKTATDRFWNFYHDLQIAFNSNIA